jgi:hypothetical protein
MNKTKKENNMIRYPKMALVYLASGCLFGLLGCGKQEEPKTPAATTSSTAAPEATVARPATPEEVALVPNGTELYSPESGKPLQKTDLTPALVYNGRLYFLCCPVCMSNCQAKPSLLGVAKPPNGYDLRKLSGAGS